MKIPLKLRKRFDEYMAFVSFVIRSPKHHIRLLPVFALVDSGSPWTSLAPMDSQLLGAPIKTLNRAVNHPRVMFAGDTFHRMLMTNVELFFKDDRGEIAKFEMPSISVLEPITRKPAEEYRGIPSVIGLDFLRIHKMALYINIDKSIAFLERV